MSLIQEKNEAGCEGNVFLDKMMGAEMYFTDLNAPYITELLPRMEKLAKKIKYLLLECGWCFACLCSVLTEKTPERTAISWRLEAHPTLGSMDTWMASMNLSSRARWSSLMTLLLLLAAEEPARVLPLLITSRVPNSGTFEIRSDWH